MTTFAILFSIGTAVLALSAILLRRAHRITRLKHFLYLSGALAAGAIAGGSLVAAEVGGASLVFKYVSLPLGLGALIAVAILSVTAGYYALFREYADVDAAYRAARLRDWWRGQLPSHIEPTHELSRVPRYKGVTFGLLLLFCVGIYVVANDFVRTSVQMKEPAAFLVIGFLVACCAAIVIGSLVWGESPAKKGTS